MTKTQGTLDWELAENLSLAGQVSNCVILAGQRQYDRFMLGGAAEPSRVVSLERLCHERFGAGATWRFDAGLDELRLMLGSHSSEENLFPAQSGAPAQPSSVPEMIRAFASTKPSENGKKLVLIIDGTLLFSDAAAPHGDDFRVLQAIEWFSRQPTRNHLIVIRVASLASVPGALHMSPSVRNIYISGASRDTRHAFALLRGGQFASQCGMTAEEIAASVSDITEGWTLDQIEGLLQMAIRQELSRPSDLEELARAVRIGTTQSPWAGERIRAAVGEAHAELTKRVKGQPAAVDAVEASLRQAVVGLAGAYQSESSQAPRATFFFAGPTGTGKTEMAKAISQLVFGEEQLVRFDCGELQQEHAVARLIGAPPGYVGYDQGGELTEAIRAKPNSVVLFDEIEKAHPRLLDTLLGVLDDGRLTSGRGETAYFGQSVLIFTSNLGMYEEGVSPEGVVKRTARFQYETAFATIQSGVRNAIRDEFVSRLGRPELLGRFGGPSSIIVFDYLRDLHNVCGKFVRNIALAVTRRHGAQLIVDDAVVDHIVRLTQAQPDALILGGRGMRPTLDALLIRPLTDFVFNQPVRDMTINVTMGHERVEIAAT